LPRDSSGATPTSDPIRNKKPAHRYRPSKKQSYLMINRHHGSVRDIPEPISSVRNGMSNTGPKLPSTGDHSKSRSRSSAIKHTAEHQTPLYIRRRSTITFERRGRGTLGGDAGAEKGGQHDEIYSQASHCRTESCSEAKNCIVS